MDSKGMKAQAAVDFMASYGFAMLIIIVAIVFIYKIGFGSVAGFTQQACTAQPGFTCDYANVNTTGILTLKMSQSIISHLRLNALACSTSLNSTGTGPAYGNIGLATSNSFYPANDNPIGTVLYGGAHSIFYINCYGPNGQLSGTYSSPVIIYVFINYTVQGYQPVIQPIITYDGAYT